MDGRLSDTRADHHGCDAVALSVPKTLAQRLGRLLETVTRQSGNLPETSYGSWILGTPAESQQRRRVRLQLILTVFVVSANLIAIGVVMVLVTVAIPEPNVLAPGARWITVLAAPAYIGVAVVVGWIWATKRIIHDLRWAIEEKPPTPEDQRNTFLAPWRLTLIPVVLWAIGTIMFATLYGRVDSNYIPKMVFGISFSGIVVSASCYFVAEFALRPVAAQALQAGRAPERSGPGVMGRAVASWLLGSGVPVIGIALAAVFTLSRRNMTLSQFGVAVLLLAVAAFVFGFFLILVAAWLTATPVRTVRAALERVEEGDFGCQLQVFDGTELGELQRGFNRMVEGLRQRERIRDLFGRHVGREVAAAAENQEIELGGEERHVAILFVDIIGSTELVAERAPTEVVDLLNRFFTVIIDEVNARRGLINKFEGDATLAIFGAPVPAQSPETDALAAARSIAQRLVDEVPECPAGVGIAAGTVVAGNVGAYERFEYTVIGDPVNEAARLCELAKSTPSHVLASAVAVRASDSQEQGCWEFGEETKLRGRTKPTLLASPRQAAKPTHQPNDAD
ncbi:adenylate cyclase [Mycobacterium kubicae]|uniref:Adenylate cyclase n=1 Tax=Mycobacterium kubicae TaxID=120959 RepID=A0ABQ1BFR1_9MYCO|nr:adenylate cyclase [Mycobacterium kubicae]